MRARSFFAFAVTLAAAALVLACGDDDDDGGRPTPSPGASPTSISQSPTTALTAVPTLAGYPTDRRMGEPEVDRVLDAATSGDPPRVQALLRWYEVPCQANPNQLGSPVPRCPAGAAEGSPVEIFPNTSCPSFRPMTRDNIDVLIDLITDSDARPVAVYRQTPRDPDGLEWPVGEYGVILIVPSKASVSPGYSVVRLAVTGGDVVSAGVACPSALLEDELRKLGMVDFVLPPP